MSWKFEAICKPFGSITEGPVWDGEFVYFTQIRAHRILRYDPKSTDRVGWAIYP
jgi:sugar lactone lactonase YvrE